MSQDHKPIISYRILCIDDDSQCRKFMSAMFTARGHQVDVAENGMQGMQKLCSGNYDVIVTDYQMPGMDGFDVAAAAREVRPNIPTVVVSGVSKDSLQTFHAAGLAITILEKPFRADDIISTLEAYLLKNLHQPPGGVQQKAS